MDIKRYNESIELDAKEGSPEFLAVLVVMQEGALRFQEQVIEALNAAGELDAIKIVEQVEFNVASRL